VRTSIAWRSGSPSTRFGNRFRKASKSAASNRLVGMNCQTIGPSFGPSSAMPLPMNRSIDSPASASTRWVVA
jgi:hypothetical protein